MTSLRREPADLEKALVIAWKTSARITEYLLENLDETLWRSEPPGEMGRTIAAIFAHIHNVRHMLLVKIKAKNVPSKLDRFKLTPTQARAALGKSADAIAAVLESAAASGGRVPNYPPDAVAFLTSAITHEVHHRGQITMLARQLGHPLSQEAVYGMWDTSKRRKEAVRGEFRGEKAL